MPFYSLANIFGPFGAGPPSHDRRATLSTENREEQKKTKNPVVQVEGFGLHGVVKGFR